MRWLLLVSVVMMAACNSGAKEREAAARAAEQAAKEEVLAAERRALAAEKRALEAARAGGNAAEAQPVPPPAVAAQPTPAAAPRAETAQPATAAAPAARGGRVTISVSARFDATKPDGKAWDIGTGPQADPMLAARVASNGKTFGASGAENSGTVTATWDADLAASDSITITAYDKDLTAHDQAGTITASFNGKAGASGGRGGAVTFNVQFSEPR